MNETGKCPFCAAPLDAEAAKCPACGKELDRSIAPAAPAADPAPAAVVTVAVSPRTLATGMIYSGGVLLLIALFRFAVFMEKSNNNMDFFVELLKHPDGLFSSLVPSPWAIVIMAGLGVALLVGGLVKYCKVNGTSGSSKPVPLAVRLGIAGALLLAIWLVVLLPGKNPQSASGAARTSGTASSQTIVLVCMVCLVVVIAFVVRLLRSNKK